MEHKSFITQLADTTSRFNRKPFIMFPAVIFTLTPLLMVISASINNDIQLHPSKVYYFIVIVVVIPLSTIDALLVLTGRASNFMINHKSKLLYQTYSDII
ncbi:MAG: hypothetical protein J6O00_06000 [Clostridiales bacterium]|nr:hypothetical protein [Clostridiales bacterium]